MRKILISILLFLSVVLNAQLNVGIVANQKRVGGTTLTIGLAYDWNFDETSGTTLNDPIGNNDIELTGATIDQVGKIGRSVDFDGTNDRGVFAVAPTAARSNVSISMWVYPHTTGTLKSLWCENISSPWQFVIDDGYWHTRDASTGTTGARNNNVLISNLTQNTWYHLIFVYSTSGGFKKVYINGSLDGSSTTSVDKLNTGTTFYIGFESDGTYYNGLIDNVHLWSRALSDTEVTELYTKENAGTTNPW